MCSDSASCGELRGNGIVRLRVTLTAQRHHERHLVNFQRIVNIVRVPPDISDLNKRFTRQFALNRNVPLVISSRPIVRVDLVCGVRLRLIRSGETGRITGPRRPLW